MADKIELKGILRLNTMDLNRLMFPVDNAERVHNRQTSNLLVIIHIYFS
ncbi:MAG: hypothetical protein IPN15_07065 [Saprospiraceae bacterium]|nr:hypothetical protein [Candidatus Vicinibacter affinis]